MSPAAAAAAARLRNLGWAQRGAGGDRPPTLLLSFPQSRGWGGRCDPQTVRMSAGGALASHASLKDNLFFFFETIFKREELLSLDPSGMHPPRTRLMPFLCIVMCL